LAVPGMFRDKIEPLGIEFAAVRPDQDPTAKHMVEMIWDIKKGTERGLREFLFPSIRDSYQDLLAAVRDEGGADLLVTGELAYAGPIVAEVTRVPWASYVLAPISFFSGYDPPVLPPYPTLAKVQSAIPAVGHAIPRFARVMTRRWPKPIYALRRELGLDRGADPIFDAKFSPRLTLAMFSRVLGDPQPDWPENTKVTGFAFYDGDAGNTSLASELEAFLAAGPPPLVFTLGSAAVMAAGNFYEVSAAAAEILGLRAVLLTGGDPHNRPKRALPESICIAPYAPFSKIFPRALAIIHQGGVGTTAQALKAGRPMLVMPYSHDQPDNARRVRHLGVAKVIRRKSYTPEAAAQKISRLLANTAYTERAAQVARIISEEDGVRTACDALENAARTRP
jgi:rhamnosyltransferase subunit B